MFEQERKNQIPILFALSTCPRCQRMKDFLEANSITAHIIDVDLLDPDERRNHLRFLSDYNPVVSMPTLLYGEQAVIGEDYEQLKAIFKLEE